MLVAIIAYELPIVNTPQLGGGDASATEMMDGAMTRLTLFNTNLSAAALAALTT
jgi:hypothetical protein